MSTKRLFISFITATTLTLLFLSTNVTLSQAIGGAPDQAIHGLTKDNYTLDDFDPLLKSGSIAADNFKDPGSIVTRVMFFAFPLAGLILFVMLIYGGFKMILQATTKKSIEEGKKIITNAIVGFILLFAAYWIFQLIQVILGVQIL